MKAEHRMGKGEFSYMRDWNNDDGAGSEKVPYKEIISSLISEEVEKQVAGKVEAAIAKAISEMRAKMDTAKEDRAAVAESAAKNATLLAKIESVEATVRALQMKPQVVQTPQGKIVMQQPMAAKPSAYSVDVVRGADGLIKSLDMVPK